MIDEFEMNMRKVNGRLSLRFKIGINGECYGADTTAPGDSDQFFCQALAGVLKALEGRMVEKAGLDLWTGKPATDTSIEKVADGEHLFVNRGPYGIRCSKCGMEQDEVILVPCTGSFG